MKTISRNFKLDWIRITALFSLISYHYLYYIGFYEEPCNGTQMLILCMLRVLFSVNIPLFLLLTGYLQTTKKLVKGYYKKCLRTVWIYVLCCVVSAIYRFVVGGISITLYGFIRSLLDFSGCPYAWYVEMYLGLFLMIPFLNILYHNLPSKGWKQILILTFIALTTLPSFLNVYRFEELQWWASPQSSSEYFKIIPSWWMAVYPITYYFIGNYIREYGLKVKRSLCAGIILIISVLMGCYGYWRSTAAPYNWGPWQDWNSWVNVLMGVLVFVFILNGKEHDVTMLETRVLPTVSKCVFGAYLLSWIAEDVVYHHIPLERFEIPNRIVFYPIVILVMLISLLLSMVVNMIYDYALIGIRRIRKEN